MKTLGYTLVATGFLIASLLAVQTEADAVPWRLYVPALAAAATGVILLRRVRLHHAHHSESLHRNTQTLRDSIDRLASNLADLDSAKHALNPGELHRRIDTLFRDDLFRFAEARLSIVTLHGLPAYAEIMSQFAAGERYLNRVWSADVDGYIDEAHEYLARARHQIEETQRLIQALQM
jgi:hypothetical protein